MKYPFFIEKPATDLIGPICYTSLLENFNLGDVDCWKLVVSKALGIGLVFGGAIVKLPQAANIHFSRSAVGISLSSYILEFASCAISSVYNHRNGYAFSTYGENVFLTAQNGFITLQIIYYQPTLTKQDNNKLKAIGSIIPMLLSVLALYIVPPSVLTLLQGLTIPISAIAKVPQILSNSRSKSTGQLSSFTVFANIAGCLARIYTTLTEVQDPLVLWGFVVASILNIVIGVQVYMYWGKGTAKSHLPTEKIKLESKPQTFDATPSTQVPRINTKSDGYSSDAPRTPPAYSPAPKASPAPSGGRRWARKVD